MKGFNRFGLCGSLLTLLILLSGCSNKWSDDETSDFYVKCTEVMEMEYSNASDACVCVRDKYMNSGKSFDESFEEVFSTLDTLEAEVEACGGTKKVE